MVIRHCPHALPFHVGPPSGGMQSWPLGWLSQPVLLVLVPIIPLSHLLALLRLRVCLCVECSCHFKWVYPVSPCSKIQCWCWERVLFIQSISFGISPRDLWTLHGHKIPGNCSKRNYRLHFLLMILLSHPYMATEKVIALTMWTFVSKVMSLFLIYCLAFFPRCKCLLISWLQLPSTVILETRKIKSSHIVKAKFFPVVKYGYESCTIKKAEHWKIDAFELWSWRRLESLLDSKEIKPFIPKGNQPWIFIARTDTEAEAPVLWSPDVKSQHIGKDSDARKDQRQKKWATENEMVGWHHWLNGNEFKQTLGDRERQGSLVCCSPWGHKESTWQ